MIRSEEQEFMFHSPWTDELGHSASGSELTCLALRPQLLLKVFHITFCAQSCEAVATFSYFSDSFSSSSPFWSWVGQWFSQCFLEEQNQGNELYTAKEVYQVVFDDVHGVVLQWRSACWRSRELSRYSLHKAGCFSSPNLILKASKIPR